MKIYTLIQEETGCDAKTQPYLNRKEAAVRMREQYEALARSLPGARPGGIAPDGSSASITRGGDVCRWRIEECELDADVIIHVHGGIVQEVFSQAELDVTVYDTDSDDADLEAEIDAMREHMDRLSKDPAWFEIAP